jgi:glucokinase
MRQSNRGAVLQLVRDRGPISRAEIGRRLGLSAATVSRVAEELLEADFVAETAPVAGAGGRPAALLRFNPLSQLVIGVDLGGARVTGVLTDAGGSVLARSTTPHAEVPPLRGRKGAPFETLCEVIQRLLDAAPQGGNVRAVATGAPGVTRWQDGVVLRAPHLGWENYPLAAQLGARFGVPALVDNDVNYAALGEARFGAGRGCSDLVCLYVGTGVGAGIVLGGDLYRGHRWAAGELGRLVPGREWIGKDFRAGLGCLETLITGPAIAGRARTELANNGSPSSGDHLDGPKPAEIFAAYADGAEFARQVIDEAADYLALCLVAIVSVLDPERIVLGGGVMHSYGLIADRVEHSLTLALPQPPGISRTQLGDEATALGAAAVALAHTDPATPRATGTAG